MRLLVTGSHGLVGALLVAVCRQLGHDVVPFDLVRPDTRESEDIRDTELLTRSAKDADGIIHLAAISRVAWGETEPALCQQTNVLGTASALAAAMNSGCRWFLFASSREVYGNPVRPLVREDDPIAPVNIYGRSKAEGETLVMEARSQGLRTAIVRLSNVYGGRRDHPDRAVPSLVARSLAGQSLNVTGGDNYFDFVHVNDCVDGLIRAMNLLAAEERGLPTVHLATGVATTLRDLAGLAQDVCGTKSPIVELPNRAFDVSGFCGSPDLAWDVLGWKAQTDLRTGVGMVAADFRQNGPLDQISIPFPGSKPSATEISENV